MEKNIIFFNFYYCISPRLGELINAKEIKFDYHKEIEKNFKILEYEDNLSSSFIIKKKIYQYAIKKIVKLFSKYPFNKEYCIAIHDMLPSALIVLIIFKFYELFHYLPHVFYSYTKKYFSYNGKYLKLASKIYPKNLNFLLKKNKLNNEYDKVYVFYNSHTKEYEIPYSKIRSNSFIRIKLPYGFYEKKLKEIIKRKLYKVLEKERDFCNNKKILFIFNDYLMAFQWVLIVIIYKFFEITNLLPDIMLLPHFLDRFNPFIISPNINKIKIIK
jgi:hypothetical protein